MPAVEITHADKLLFPEDGISKGELADYYEAVADVMLPHLSGRPLTMERYPAGITHKGFIQKNVVKGFPDWLQRIEVGKKAGSSHYPIVDDLRSLLWVANQNCITPHVWPACLPELTQPDLCVIDLDPSREDPGELKAAALSVRDLLGELGLNSWLKTSGSKGFHILVPLNGKASFDTVWQFAHALGAVLVQRHPQLLTQEFSKADRGERILVDTGRNGYGATFAATYAVRPKPGAPVSAPCTWQELERDLVTPRSFSLRTMRQRLLAVGDLFADLARQPQDLEAAHAALSARLSEEDWQSAITAATRRPGPRRRASSTKPRKK